MYEGGILAFIEADTGLWSTPEPIRGPIADRRQLAAEDERPAVSQRIAFRGRFSTPPAIILAPMAVDFAGTRLEYFLRPEQITTDSFVLSLYVDGLPDSDSRLAMSVQWLALRKDLFN